MRNVSLIVVLVLGLAARGSVLFADESTSVRVMVGRSAIVNTGWPIARVSLTSADVADAMVTLPNQLLIQGKVPGTISMFVWDRAGAMRTYDVTVERDLSRLAQQVRELFPGEAITVEGSGKSIVIAGKVASKYIADKAAEVAGGYVENKEDVVSLMQVQDPGPTPQVLLRVRFAEVSRNAMTELGAALFTGANGYKDVAARATTQQFAFPDFENSNSDNKLVFSDFLNLFVFDLKHQLGIAIKALQNKGMFQSLAEPNLVAESGKEASFLAGGEFPIPVAQGGGANLAISVVFKEFGIRLNFTPTVTNGGRVRLKVRPEVSTLDFSNGIVLQGFRIPALSTRRTETEVELQDGQTFAIAGLLNNTATQSMSKVPGIGDIPILGLLFRSKAAQKQQTELVVMITPQILTRGSSGVTSELPRTTEPYLAPLDPAKTFPAPPPAFTAPRPSGDAARTSERPTTTPAASTAAPKPKPTAAESAAVLAERMGKAPKFVGTPQTVEPAPPAATPTAVTPTGSSASSAFAAVSSAPAADKSSSTRSPAGPPAMSAKEEKQLQQRLADERTAQERQLRNRRELEKKNAQAAREQAKRDAEAARDQATRDAEAAEKAAKAASRQAEIDRKRQKAIDEAAARVKAAENAYQSELSKKVR